MAENIPPKENGDLQKETTDKVNSEGKGQHEGRKKHRVKRSKFRRYTPHVLVWILAGTTLRVVFSSVEVWPTPMQWHVILGVIGYQVLMGHGTLLIHTMAHKDFFFFPNTNKKTLHWIITLLGFACVSAGFYYIYFHYKEEHFNSIHGVLGLVSFVLTVISLVNGTIFYYWQELGIGKGNIKFIHTLTGLLAFVASTLCLMYGYNKKTFLRWSSPGVAYGLMAVCAVSVAFFSLSPGNIILNKLRQREHDEKAKETKERSDQKVAKKE